MPGTMVGVYSMEKSDRRVEEPHPVIVTMTFRRPEHEEELREALNAPQFNSVLWNLDQWLRNEIKHGDDEVRMNHLQSARDKLWSLMEDAGLSLE